MSEMDIGKSYQLGRLPQKVCVGGGNEKKIKQKGKKKKVNEKS